MCPPGRRLLLVASIALLGCSEGMITSDGELLPDLAPDLVDPTKPLVDLRADTNRDGKVDISDPSEDLKEDVWDANQGAIFLANIDDDESVCQKTGTDVALAACHDAADEKVNGAADALDLAPLRIVPWPLAPDDAVGSLSLSPAAAPHVRLFKKRGAAYTLFRPEVDKITAAELRAGVELAIEGKDIVRDPQVWDGFVDISFTVKMAAETPPSDKVRMRLAPLVTQHHLSQPHQVYASSIPAAAGSAAMLNDLAAAIAASGIAQPLVKLNINDQWTQDLFEVATMSMPAPGGQHAITVFIRSANVENPLSTTNPLRPAGQVVFSLRGKDAAAVQQFDSKHSMKMDTLNSFGNTETIPPYTLAGKSYPLGRLFRGSSPAYFPDPEMTKLLEAQRVQPPVYIDTSWLLVGHVDETITFIKAPSPRGWAVAVNDPTLARTMLQQQTAAGYGGTKMFVGKKWLDAKGFEYSAEVTINAVLADTSVMSPSATAAVEVAKQIAVLKSETGITDGEILHVPFLHSAVSGYAVAYQVNTINGISLGDAHFGAADPHGPVINGKDIFKQQMEAEFAKVGITVHWIEDWDLYHRLEGEVHCGSNTARQLSPAVKWWESGR